MRVFHFFILGLARASPPTFLTRAFALVNARRLGARHQWPTRALLTAEIHSAVVTPDAGRAPTEPTSKFWGVRWDAQNRRWRGDYKDADGKSRSAGLHDTQELAAHAYNAAVRALPADVQARRKTNPVVDGQLVPKPSRKRPRADAPDARRTSAHAAPVPQTSDKKPCANCGGRPCDGVEFERFASSGKRHKTCTTCKADRTLRKAAAQLRVLANPKKP